MEDNKKIKVLIRFDGKELALTLHLYKSETVRNPNQMYSSDLDFDLDR